MKMFKMFFVLFCLLAYLWAFSLPAKGQDFKPLYAPHPQSAAADTALPFQATVERNSPLFGDRQMTLKIADVQAGQQVTVLEITGAARSGRPMVLFVSYADRDGKERAGWFYGTLHVHVPN